MDASDNPFSDIVGVFKSLIPRRSEPANVSRDFWMPDHSVRVCYECDSQFTLFNRRHHCRLCGRVFCGSCTSNWVPAGDSSTVRVEDSEKLRACNFCYKQWEQGGLGASADHGVQVTTLDLSTSPSASSLLSSKSSGTPDSSVITFASVPQSDSSYQQIHCASELIPTPSAVMESTVDESGLLATSKNSCLLSNAAAESLCQAVFSMSRSDQDDDFCSQFGPEARTTSQISTDCFDQVHFDEMYNDYGSRKVHPDGDMDVGQSVSSSSLYNTFDLGGSEVAPQLDKKGENCDECDASSSVYASEDVDAEPVDFENNGVLWLPPEPEDEEDEREASLFDDDDDGDAAGEWGYLRNSSSFGSGEFRNRDRSNEEHKKAMKNVVDGHFRALVAQLLEVEDLPVSEEDEKGNWLEIITSLSWEAASLLKPDTSRGGGMDPGGYVKIKCLASGCRSDSMVVKGVVCKKNVAHRRMASKIEKPRFLILGGALEYQRVSNHLSSFDTLLQQEMDHLKMAVAKIDAHQPDILLVEKSVSRYAQEYLLAKDISLVLNIKRPLLERIARCTGAQIVPSIDHLSSQKLGYCDMFHVERFLEEHCNAEQGGKKLAKTLMYFEGCPKPFGCTILLKGACEDELKKVKHVLQYGVFAAYHLALETSFLADEGATLPELPLNSPITVALPDKPSKIGRSISTVTNFTISVNEKTQGPVSAGDEPQRSKSVPTADLLSCIIDTSLQKKEAIQLPALPDSKCSLPSESPLCSASLFSIASPRQDVSDTIGGEFSQIKVEGREYSGAFDFGSNCGTDMGSHEIANGFEPPQANHCSAIAANGSSLDGSSVLLDVQNVQKETISLKEEFPPSPSDHQSILVSLSSRCVWKGTVCERSHLCRIKYYGSFDKPLGRFLRDNLFDQGYRCRSCEMPSEAHVQCYTHRQGTLTISVKKFPEFLLPGEKEGKIWMWHRCLRCPRTNGFPPATRRIVMSDAAWGLSFGKFLELSFSNHAAASRVASCGHSLHRDCLRFYGFGKMVACFRYASIDVHSVYLPPSKLDFNYENQEWIRNAVDEVVGRAELLFSEVLNALSQMAEKRYGTGLRDASMKLLESRHQIAELEKMLQKEKAEFEELLQKILNREVKKGQPVIDILDVNKLHRQLLFQAYVWDRRLISAVSVIGNQLQVHTNSLISEQADKSVVSNEKPIDKSSIVDQERSLDSCENRLVDANPNHNKNEGSGRLDFRLGEDKDLQPNREDENQAEVNNSKDSIPSIATVVACRTHLEGQFSVVASLSDTLEAAWIGENQPKDTASDMSNSDVTDSSDIGKYDSEEHGKDQGGSKPPLSSPVLSTISSEKMDDYVSWLGMPFVNIYKSLNKNLLGSSQKVGLVCEYNPVYISSFRNSEQQGGPHLVLPMGMNDSVIPVYDDEPTSIIAYALLLSDSQLSDEFERPKEAVESFSTTPDSGTFQSSSLDEVTLESYRSLGLIDEGLLSSRSSLVSDPLSYTNSAHARVSFADGPLGKVKYTVTCYDAKRFEALRRICCPSEIDFVRSLSRCKKWGAQGGKSNVFFAKTLDDRFIIKQVTKTELESFMKFSPSYFKYLSESIRTGSPTCLAKILGIYQVTSKHMKSGKETKMDVLVMENLLFKRNISRLYDLKGSTRSRYNPDTSGSNKVLLDQNLIEAMPTSPIFVGNKAKRLLERAVWNDTAFLASIDVMDYSLLVGVDEEKHELVLGIIDFMRQYTWDKHLETWVKASGILGGPKNAAPTVISPKQYKKRFRKAMTTYFLMVPDQWSPPLTITPSKSQTDLREENNRDGVAAAD